MTDDEMRQRIMLCGRGSKAMLGLHQAIFDITRAPPIPRPLPANRRQRRAEDARRRADEGARR